jgi:hypothetical protein
MNRVELGLWTRGVELMDSFVHEIGAYSGWNGWAFVAEYEAMQSKLRNAREKFIERESRNEEERQQWRLVFLFPAV